MTEKTRVRRGKTVAIPPEWVRVITTDQTKRKRKSIAQQKVFERRQEIRRSIKREEILSR